MAIESDAHWQTSESGLLVPDRPESRSVKGSQHPVPANLGEDPMNRDRGKAPSEGGPIPSIGRPGELGVASPFDGNPGEQMNVLARAGLAEDTLALTAFEGENSNALADWLEEDAQRHCLIFWQSPIIAVARGMAAGLPPDEALAQWLERAEALMGAVRRSRRRTTLVESTLAQAHPALLGDRLNQRLALSLSIPPDSAGTIEEQDPVELLIAERTVVANTLAHRITQELEATSLPLGHGYNDLLPDPLTAWQGYRVHGKIGREETEQIKEENRKLRQEQQSLKRQLEEHQANESSARSSEQQELKEENDLLLQQLHHVQEELESYYLESREAQQKYQKAEDARRKLVRERNSATQRAEVLQKKIDSMRKSRSWRLTKPLRAGNFFRRKKAK
jgi:hypothetical protein